MIQHVFLFDIDGTLISTGGAGRRAMERSFQAVHGVHNALKGFKLAGRVDGQIYQEITASRKVRSDFVRYQKHYFEYLREELTAKSPRGRVMPGVVPLLERLTDRKDAMVGLLTGNWEEGARIKLEHYGIWDKFSFGAFGDDASERRLLPPIARQRAREMVPAGAMGKGTRFYVIGDTPRDVECAQKSGCVAVAVATGDYGVSALADWTPHVLLDSLSDTDAVCELLLHRVGVPEWNWTPIFDRYRKCEIF